MADKYRRYAYPPSWRRTAITLHFLGFASLDLGSIAKPSGKILFTNSSCLGPKDGEVWSKIIIGHLLALGGLPTAYSLLLLPARIVAE